MRFSYALIDNHRSVCFAVNMGALAAGCALTWSSPTLDKLKNGEWGSGERITDDQASWVGSLVTLGAAVGPILAGALLDRLGRKNTILLSMVLSTISWITVGFVPSLHALYGARVLGGVAVGIVFTAVPMYIAEISEVRFRRTFSTVKRFMLTFPRPFECCHLLYPSPMFLTGTKS